MKKKAFLFTMISTMVLLSSNSQDFAPIGSKWHYSEYFVFSGDISYLSIESVGDTLIHGKNCRILENSGGLACVMHNFKDFVYCEDSVVYFFVPQIDTFQILYDLKAQKGSSWIVVFGVDIESKLDTIKVVVDSVSAITINSKKLKKLNVKYKSLNYAFEHLEYTGEIIEKIGDKRYLFNFYTLSGIVCDGNFSGGLRCYEDSDIGFYSTGIAESCTYTYNWVGTDNPDADITFDIFPNPATGQFTVSFGKNQVVEATAEIYNAEGKLVLKQDIQNVSATFNLTSYSKGIYFLKIITYSKIFNKKILLK